MMLLDWLLGDAIGASSQVDLVHIQSDGRRSILTLTKVIDIRIATDHRMQCVRFVARS